MDMKVAAAWDVRAHPDGTCHVTRSEASYPLKFIVPTKDERYSVLYVLGFGGGLVAGDSTRVEGAVHEDAVAVLKTQGTTKVFKSVHSVGCHQHVCATVARGGLLAFLPDPTTCFKDAVFKQHQRYELHPLGSAVIVDWYTSGRMGLGETWELARLQSKLEVLVDRRQLLLENLDLHDTPGVARTAAKVGNAAAFGLVVLAGPRTDALRVRAGAIMRRQTFKQRREHGDEAALGTALTAATATATTAATPTSSSSSASSSSKGLGGDVSAGIAPGEPLVAVSQLGDGLCVVRFAAESTEDAYLFLHDLLAPLASGALSSMPPPYADRLHSLPRHGRPLSRAAAALRDHDASLLLTDRPP